MQKTAKRKAVKKPPRDDGIPADIEAAHNEGFQQGFECGLYQQNQRVTQLEVQLANMRQEVVEGMPLAERRAYQEAESAYRLMYAEIRDGGNVLLDRIGKGSLMRRIAKLEGEMQSMSKELWVYREATSKRMQARNQPGGQP